MQISFIIIL